MDGHGGFRGGRGRGFNGGGRGGRAFHAAPHSHPHSQTEKSAYNVCRYHLKSKCGKQNCSFQHVCHAAIRLEPHNGAPVTAVGMLTLPNGVPKLLTGSKDGKINIWDLASIAMEHSIDVAGPVTHIEVVGDLVFFACNEPIAPEQKELMVGVVHLLFSADMTTVSIKRSENMPYTDPFGNILHFAAKVINDVVFVITAGDSGVIRTWRYDSAQRRFEHVSFLEGHFRSVTSLLLIDNLLWSGSSDQTIRVWDMSSFQWLGTLHGHTAAVSSLALIPPSQSGGDVYVASGGIDCDVRIWRTTGENVHTVSHPAPVTSLCAFQDSHGGIYTLLVGLANGGLHVRSGLSMALLFSIDPQAYNTKHVYKINSLSSSCFSMASQDGQLIVWNVEMALQEPSAS